MDWREIINDLVCPACKEPLALSTAGDSLKCGACRRVYPVEDEIPILLIDRAKVEP